jgi:hypothetical protein
LDYAVSTVSGTGCGTLIDYDYYPAGTPSGAGKTSDIFGPYGVDLHFTYDGRLTTETAWSGDVNGSVAWLYNTDFNKTRETVTGPLGSGFTVFRYDDDQLLTLCVVDELLGELGDECAEAREGPESRAHHAARSREHERDLDVQR